jgi:phosphotransferase system enzyme I (PtsI)
MQILQGIPVSPGVAIGEALVVGREGFRIPQRFVARSAIDDELQRFRQALAIVEEEIDENRCNVAKELGEQYGAIFAAHLQIVRDQKLRGEIESLISERQYSPEYSVSRVLRGYVQKFQALENARLAERADDIFDIEKRLLRNLLGQRREELSKLTSPVVILAHNLTPSETANLDPDMVIGFATEVGGLGSHTAIVAEAQGIPAVVGSGEFLAEVSGGETVIVDGETGRVFLRPDEETIARYRHEIDAQRALTERLQSSRDLPAQTQDGTTIRLHANIEFPTEVDACVAAGASGIGLFRTEFLYLVSATDPDEETQYTAYAKVVEAMAGKPVVIRTQDLGADKIRGLSPSQDEKNPFLGLRSIRLSLRDLPAFRTQLRAILRASTLGDVRVMFPLISTIGELRQAKMVLADVMEDLDEVGIPYNKELPIGMMVEVPAAVMMLDRFVEEVDFFSIGTNDLIQYALAVDRSNSQVAGLYNAADPAVLRLIQMTVAAGSRAGLDVSLCGQMSGSSTYTMLLLGLGLRELSVPPKSILEIKQICRSTTISQCEKIAHRALAMEGAREIKTMLREELRKLAPEFAAP